MKNIIGILFVLFSMTAFSQFIEPSNFDFSYDYIKIDETGPCAGQWVSGPTYCSHFTWNTPDTNSTNATFNNYNLYYYSFNNQDTTLLTTTTDIYFNMQIGIIGKIWVTAMYSNPDGESLPSNIILNEALPISIDENQLENELNIFYDNINQKIRIINGTDISMVNIFNIQGKLIETENIVDESINIDHLRKGLYFVEIIKDNKETIRQKIIK